MYKRSYEESEDGKKEYSRALREEFRSVKILNLNSASEKYNRALIYCPADSNFDSYRKSLSSSKADCDSMLEQLRREESEEKRLQLLRATELQNKLLADQAAREKSATSVVADQKSNQETQALRASLNDQAKQLATLQQTLANERLAAQQSMRESSHKSADLQYEFEQKLVRVNLQLTEMQKVLSNEKSAKEQLALEKKQAEKVANDKLLAEKAAREKDDKEKRDLQAKLSNLAQKFSSLESVITYEKLTKEKLIAEKSQAEKIANEKLLAERSAREKDEKEKREIQEKLNALTNQITAIQKATSSSSSIVFAPPQSGVRDVLPSMPISGELFNWISELRISGVDPKVMAECKAVCVQWQQKGLLLSADVSQFKNDFIYLQKQIGLLDQSLNSVHQSCDNDEDAKAERDYIKQHPKLLHYQNKLQQELTKFIFVYFISTTGVLQLTSNKKGMILDAISNLPLAGQFLKIFISGLQFANDKYRSYQINHLTDLFKGIEAIERTCVRFSRQMAICKEEEIQQQITFVPSGVLQRARGFYDDVKDMVHHEWHDLKISNTTGITLQAEEKLAMLDAALLLQKVLSGDAKIDRENDLVNQFLSAALQKSGYEYKTPSHVKLKCIQIVKDSAMLIPAGFQQSTVKNIASLNSDAKKPTSLLADLQATIQQKGLDKKALENTISCITSARVGSHHSQSSVVQPFNALDFKRADADKNYRTAAESTRKQLNKRIDHPRTLNEVRLEQARIYFLQCSKEREYFMTQQYSPLFYFKLIFASHLNEFFVRCYLLSDPRMNYQNIALALTEEEISSFRKFVYYACPLSKNMYKFFELLSPFVTRGIVEIFDDKLTKKNSYAEVNAEIEHIVSLFRAALLKAMRPILASESRLFDSPIKCVGYLLNCLIDFVPLHAFERMKTQNKVQVYLQLAEKELKVTSLKTAKHDLKMFHDQKQITSNGLGVAMKDKVSDKYDPILIQRK